MWIRYLSDAPPVLAHLVQAGNDGIKSAPWTSFATLKCVNRGN